MKTVASTALGVAFALSGLLTEDAAAQSAPSHYAWQDNRTFEPSSTTAQAVTGPLTLSGEPDFAVPGEKLTIQFADGPEFETTSVGASSRHWKLSDEDNYTAEVFQFDENPGVLPSGNSLCGDAADGEAVYVVFHESHRFGSTLNMAAFSSPEPPQDINSDGLCGTFSYAIEEEQGLGADMDAARPWSVREEVNPLDDTKTVSLARIADSGVSVYGEPIVFIARCRSNETEVYIDWRSYLGSANSWKDVTVRIGEGEAQEQRWGLSTDNEATFAPGWAGNLLKQMVGHNRLVAKTVPYNENPIVAIFDIRGLEQPLRQVAETCSWSF